MSNTSGYNNTLPGGTQPRPPLPAAAFQGVRTRRTVALLLDFIAVTLISLVIWFLATFLTLGLALFVLPPLFPIVAFFYNGITVSGWRKATPGMKAMDLQVEMADTGTPVPFINAAVQAVLFYVSWMFPPILLWTLLDGQKRCLHDIFSGIVITRRPW